MMVVEAKHEAFVAEVVDVVEAFGVPVLYAYIFAAWALLVALMALAVESRR